MSELLHMKARLQMRLWPRAWPGAWPARLLLAVTAASGAASGCSQMYDPAQPGTAAPEQNVRNYYILLETKPMEYRYDLTSQNEYQPSSDVLIMDMQGADQYSSYHSIPVCSCKWSYVAAGAGSSWAYALCDTEAVALGIDWGGQYEDSWVDLKAPLAAGSSWSFTSQGESVTATVTKYAVSAAVNGQTYDDVVEVDYKGASGTTGTNWFARGIGTIYSHIERPGNQMIDLKFVSKSE